MTYEEEQLAKFKLVIDAACQNPTCHQDVEIKTSGYEPSASVKIPAYILKKLVK